MARRFECWPNRLARKGLTQYSTAKEYNAALARLATIAFIYDSWIELAYNEHKKLIDDYLDDLFKQLPWIRHRDISGLPFDSDDKKDFCIYHTLKREHGNPVKKAFCLSNTLFLHRRNSTFNI